MSVSVVQLGAHDAVLNGELVTGIPSRLVFVSTAQEVSQVGANYQAGSLAATWDFKSMWVKVDSTNWRQIAGTGAAEIADDPAGG